MSNAVIKAILLCILSGLCGCSGGGKQSPAEALLTHAEELKTAGKYSEALALIDSLDRNFKAEVDIRRKGMQLRPLLMEQTTNRELEIADSMAVVTTIMIDSLSKQAQFVPNAIEGYFVSRSTGPQNVTSTVGLHGRMAPDGRFYLVATSPSSCATSSITLSSGGLSETSATIPYDGERNYRASGRDILTFTEAESTPLGKFVFEHKQQPISVSYNGKSSTKLNLSAAQISSAAQLYELSELIRERKRLELEKARLEKRLDAIRSQMARTAIVDTVSAN